MHNGANNCVVLAGRIDSDPQTRFSPAGIPITRFTLEHESKQLEAGKPRDVRCKIAVVAAGESLQSRAAVLQQSATVRVTGFLASGGYRSGEYRLVLHAEDIELLD